MGLHLAHPLGAVFALADNGEPVTLVLGTGGGWRFSIGRLTMDLSLLAASGLCLSRGGTWLGMLLGVLAGPLVSLAFAGLLYVLALGYPSLALPLGVGAAWSAFMGLDALVPRRSSWLGKNDGLLAVTLITRRREIPTELRN